MSWRAACVLLTGLFPAISWEVPHCGSVHCYGSSVYCCTDSVGELTCCYKSLYQESWFWIILVIGLVLIAALLFFSCRAIYRYHNASQYTKLRLQHPHGYGTISGAGANTSSSRGNEDCGQLPSYAAVMSMPPAYNEANTGR